MSDQTLPSFRYRLEQQPPHTSCGGLVRGASVRQFPVSQNIAGASMRLQPGCLRELHWHTTAAELGYVVSGSCRTTVLSPDGAATDTFGPGDVWYFPSGWGVPPSRLGEPSQPLLAGTGLMGWPAEYRAGRPPACRAQNVPSAPAREWT
jgi:oxalate decarboxylase